MATRTISAAGGNWNSLATWVGGVVPTAADDVVGDATSGNIVVNVNTATVREVNLSNYLGTMTLNAILNIGSTLTYTSIFSATMSFATSTSYSDTRCINITQTGGNAINIRTNGKKLPWLLTSKGGGQCNINLLDDLNVSTLSIGYGNANTNIAGTYSVYCNHFYRMSGGGGSTGGIATTTSRLIFTGPTASYSGVANNTQPPAIQNIPVVIDVGATGTFSTFMPFALSGVTSVGYSYTWTSGILAGTKELSLFDNGSTATVRLNFANAGTWSAVYYVDTSTADRNLQLNSDLFFDNLIAQPSGSNITGQTRRALVLSGSGALKGGRLSAIPYVNQDLIAFSPTWGAPTYSTPMIKLVPGPIHQLSDIRFQGYDDGPIQLRNFDRQANKLALIQSSTASVRATLNFTGASTNYSYWVQYTDINASGGNTIYNFDGGQSNSLNIGTVSFGGSGGSGGSFTFVN